MIYLLVQLRIIYLLVHLRMIYLLVHLMMVYLSVTLWMEFLGTVLVCLIENYIQGMDKTMETAMQGTNFFLIICSGATICL